MIFVTLKINGILAHNNILSLLDAECRYVYGRFYVVNYKHFHLTYRKTPFQIMLTIHDKFQKKPKHFFLESNFLKL